MTSLFTRSFLALTVLCCSVLVSADPSQADQPDVNVLPETSYQPELVARNQFPVEDFTFDFLNVDSETPNGRASALNVATNPLLGTLPGHGIGQNLISLGPCAINQPHVHPRGTEFTWITQGTVTFALVEENGGRFVESNVTAGQTFIIPQGLLHYAINHECEPAQLLTSFPTRDSGTQTIASALFKFPMDVLRATLGASEEDIQKIIDAVKDERSKNPSFNPDCLARCGIYAPPTYPYTPPAYPAYPDAPYAPTYAEYTPPDAEYTPPAKK